MKHRDRFLFHPSFGSKTEKCISVLINFAAKFLIYNNRSMKKKTKENISMIIEVLKLFRHLIDLIILLTAS